MTRGTRCVPSRGKRGKKNSEVTTKTPAPGRDSRAARVRLETEKHRSIRNRRPTRGRLGRSRPVSNSRALSNRPSRGSDDPVPFSRDGFRRAFDSFFPFSARRSWSSPSRLVRVVAAVPTPRGRTRRPSPPPARAHLSRASPGRTRPPLGLGRAPPRRARRSDLLARAHPFPFHITRDARVSPRAPAGPLTRARRQRAARRAHPRVRHWLNKAGLAHYWNRLSSLTEPEFGALGMVDYAALGIVDSADKQKLFRLIKNLNAEGAFKTDATVDATPAHPARPARAARRERRGRPRSGAPRTTRRSRSLRSDLRTRSAKVKEEPGIFAAATEFAPRRRPSPRRRPARDGVRPRPRAPRLVIGRRRIRSDSKRPPRGGV